MIHVFVGTRAEYIKMAPLLWRMESAGVPYRLIDSGQHADRSGSFRDELGLPAPDHAMGGTRSVDSVPAALWWAAGLGRKLALPRQLDRDVFDGRPGICVVHGDTPTTLIGALMAKRAGLALAHVEAGLRTHRWLHPFPEEIVRVAVDRLADLLFAPSDAAAEELRERRVGGRIITGSSNTISDALRAALEPSAAGTPTTLDMSGGARSHSSPRRPSPVVVTMHRVENLHRRPRRQALVHIVTRLAQATPVRWYVHEPTRRALRSAGQARLEASGVELVPMVPYAEFVRALARAPFAITDGGSIQEECALLGVPVLLWRDRTDRADGIGENVMLSRYDPGAVEAFLADPERWRRARRLPQSSPSQEILEVLADWV
ncbi:MAG: UDP-N-acetylglucosamine 2-epimerase, partial [Acidimicrobiaceae bacterium]|nr:UDP-N-acetylglucosamine 2-epimerase [Acidimicrobiaceae bacterium]